MRHFLNLAVQLRGRGLVEPGFFGQPQDTDGFQEPQGTQGIGIGSILRFFKRDRDMGLGRKVIYFIGLDSLDDPDQAGGIGHITMMENEAAVLFVGILVQVIDPVCIEQRGPSLDAMNLISFFEQKFRQVGSVLSGYAGNECFFHWFVFSALFHKTCNKKQENLKCISSQMVIGSSKALILAFFLFTRVRYFV